MFNNTTQLKLPDSAREALLKFVREGKGVIGIHAATDSFYDWPEGAALLGGLFDGHPWGAGGTWAFKLDEPAHRLNRAWQGKGFKLQDEIYQFKAPYTPPRRRVLVSLDLSDPATGWVVKQGVKRPDRDFLRWRGSKRGKGRVFYCSLGHAANVFQPPTCSSFIWLHPVALGRPGGRRHPAPAVVRTAPNPCDFWDAMNVTVLEQ